MPRIALSDGSAHYWQDGMAALAKGMVARMFTASYRERGDPFLATLATVFERTDPAGYGACCAVLRDADLHDATATVRVPALVVRGRHDPLIDDASAQALTAGLPNGTDLALDCGHYPMVELPGQFSDAVVEFLAAAAAQV